MRSRRGHGEREEDRLPGVRLLTVAVTLALATPARADDAWENKGEAGAGVEINDNALLGRRGQFVLERITDVALVLHARDESAYQLDPETRLVGIAQLISYPLRTERELRNAEGLADVSVERALGGGRLMPGLVAIYHLEDESEWSFWSLAPRIQYELPPIYGVLATAGYRYTRQDFATDLPRRTFANVDNTSHRGELNVRLWPRSNVRVGAIYTLERLEFSPDLDYSIQSVAAFVGLPQGESRRDVTNAVQPEVAWVRDGLVLGLGYRFEDSHSNSDAFTYISHRAVAIAYWEPCKGHSLFVDARYGPYGFFRFHFDPRFVDTRHDTRLDVVANYRYVVSSHLYAQARYTRVRNVSNDSVEFDPITSLSFSTFAQNRIELSVLGTF